MKTVKTMLGALLIGAALIAATAVPVTAKQMEVGDRGPDVKEAQEKLAELGYDVGLVDGIFGNKTRSAVRQFQTDNDLPVTGIIDDDTWDTLKDAKKAEPKEEVEKPEEPQEEKAEDEAWQDFGESDEGGEPSVTLELGGFVRTANAMRFQEGEGRFPKWFVFSDVAYYSANEPTPKLSLQENQARLFLKMDFQSNISSYAAVDVTHHSKPDRPFENNVGVEVDEAYLRYSGEKIGLTVGKEKVVWGIIDVMSPFNILNSADLVDPFVNTGLTDAQGQWQAHFNLDIVGKFRLEALYVPIWTRSRVPNAFTSYVQDAEGRNIAVTEADFWLPPIFSAIPSFIYIPDAVWVQDEYGNVSSVDMIVANQFNGIKRPKLDLSSASFASRILLSWGQFDLGGYFITTRDRNPNPVVDIQILTGEFNFEEPLGTRYATALFTQTRQEFARVFAWGGSIETVQGRFRLKHETGLTYGHKFFPDLTTVEGMNRLFSKAYAAQADYAGFREEGEKYLSISSLFGTEYTIPGVDVITSAQLGWTHRFGYKVDYFGEANYINLTLYAQKSMMSDQMTASVASMIETNSSSFYVTPRLKYVPTYWDFLEFGVGANLFFGKREVDNGFFVTYSSILGSYKKYSNIFVTAKALFSVPVLGG
jgi:hypothetical protein